MKTFAILLAITLLIMPAQAIALSAENSVTNTYMQEKTKYLNQQDWRQYNNTQGNYYIVLDDQHYLVQINQGKIVDVKEGVPNTYDYKIVTDTKTANKWFSIADHYLEHGELTFRHRYWDLPILRLQTSIQRRGTYGNVAQIASAIKTSITHAK